MRVYRPNQDPRDIKIVFEFEPNEYLESSSLYIEKLFRYSSQKAEASSFNADKEPSQLISEKVNIKWKKDRDLTKPTKGVAPSFFTWFSWTGEDNDVFEDGEELAIFIAEDLYPNAVKYFTDALQENEENEDEEIDLENENGDNIPEVEPPKKKTKL